jgi:hypothetical protein
MRACGSRGSTGPDRSSSRPPVNRFRPMSYVARGTIRAAVLVVLLFVGGLVLTSCDLASGGSTLILNANLPNPPTVQYRFEYTQEDVTNGGQVEVPSTIKGDDLETIIEENGGNQVIAARVDSVEVRRVSASSLTAADLYLGTDASGPLIGSVQFETDQDVVRDTDAKTVTDAVKQGKGKTFAQFRVDDPEGFSVVRADVYFWVKVR